MQHQRYVLLIFVACAILIGVTVQAAGVSLFEQFAIADTRLFGLTNLSTLIALAGGAITFVGLIRYPPAVSYADEVVDELLKVTWPTREETLRAATTVVVTTGLIAALVGFYDLVWKNLADFFLFNQS
jgi:preprotein translocase SecE subunit